MSETERQRLLELRDIVVHKQNLERTHTGEKARARFQTYGWIKHQLDLILDDKDPLKPHEKENEKLGRKAELDAENLKMPLNDKCRNYNYNSFDGATCAIHADMAYCTTRCRWATNYKFNQTQNKPVFSPKSKNP